MAPGKRLTLMPLGKELNRGHELLLETHVDHACFRQMVGSEAPPDQSNPHRARRKEANHFGERLFCVLERFWRWQVHTERGQEPRRGNGMRIGVARDADQELYLELCGRICR